MHVAERLAHDGIGCRRVAEQRPIGTGNIAAPDRLLPKPVQRFLILGLGELLDGSVVAPVQRLLYKFSATLWLSCERHTLLVQVMVAGALGAINPELDQQAANLRARKTGTNDRAMYARMHIPDCRALLGNRLHEFVE